jgi:glycosyltransferase involved in cell wall biosynthesis
MKKIRVAFTSIFYPVFMGRYILEALLRRKDVEVWTAGLYTGTWIPWMGGMHLPKKYVYTPDLQMPLGMPAMINYALIESKCPFQPDLWLEVNSTLITAGRPKSGTYAIVATDPHVINYDSARSRADVLFNMQKPYMKSGDVWLPYAYDPIWHAETTLQAKDRLYDAALVGMLYPSRADLAKKLRAAGMEIFFENGPAYDDAREIYHNARVGVNWSSLKDTTARVYELMALGIAPVLNRVPDLMEMFQDGQDFMGFDDAKQAQKIIVELARDPERCDELGRAARRAVEPHSWDSRVEQIFDECGLLEKE